MGNFFALYEFPALVPPRVTKLVVFDVHREGMGESCGEGSLVTLENEAKSKFSKYGYVCHNIFGDAKTTNMSEQQRLAEMIVPLIRMEQDGEKIPHPPPTLHAPFYVHLPPSTTLCLPPTLHHSMFTSHPPPFYVHLPPSTILCSPPTLHHTMFTSHPPPFYVHLPPSTILCSPSTLHHAMFTSHPPPYYVHLPYAPSTILCSPPTLHHSMFTSHPPPFYVHLPPSTMLCSPPTLHHVMFTSHLPPFYAHLLPPPCYVHLPPSTMLCSPPTLHHAMFTSHPPLLLLIFDIPSYVLQLLAHLLVKMEDSVFLVMSALVLRATPVLPVKTEYKL